MRGALGSELEQELARVLDNFPLGIRIVTGDGELLYANKAILDIYRYDSVEELRDTPTAQRYTAESYAEHRERVRRRKRGEPVPDHYEISIRRKNGQIRHLAVHRTEVTWRGKKQFLSVYEDITERREAEEQLRESEERYRALFDSSLVGTFVIDAESLRVVLANQAAGRMFGFASVEEGLGVSPLDFVPEEDRERVFRIIMEDMFEHDLRQPHEFRALTTDGREVWIMAVGARIQCGGKMAGLISVVDITEQKRVQEELRRSEERWRYLCEGIAEAMVVFRFPDLRVTYWNRRFEDYVRQVYDKSVEEVSFEDLMAAVDPGDREISREMLSRTLAGKPVPEVYELKVQDVKGKTRFVEVRPVFYKEKGRVVGIQTTIVDITERKEAEEALRRSFINLAETISRAVESSDPYTAGHQRGAAELAYRVGQKMGLDRERLLGLYIGALLHDIGKISVPASILTKAGKLTEEEWALIRSHTRRGYEILSNTYFPWPVADMVLHHHERLDGSGYPDGISGDSLSLEVRILGVCDVVEAMGSHRPYRPARSKEEVIQELEGGRGSKYDPYVVDLVLDMIRNGELDP